MKVSDVLSLFRIFIWILVFISPCLDISFCFTDVICWTGTSTFIDFTSRVWIFVSQTKHLLIFLLDHLTAISNFWWAKDCNLSKNLIAVFSLLMQYGISTKIIFLGCANQKSGITSSYYVCLSIIFWWNWWMKLSTNLVGKPAKWYFSLIVSFSWSKFILIW